MILINTCSVRDNAEQLHLGPSGRPAPLPQEPNPSLRVGIIGCMAERLKERA